MEIAESCWESWIARSPDTRKEVEECRAWSKTASAAWLQVEKAWRHDGRPVFKFEGIDSISDAENRGKAPDVLVPASEVEPPEEGAYSYADLVGCMAVRGTASGGRRGDGSRGVRRRAALEAGGGGRP